MNFKNIFAIWVVTGLFSVILYGYAINKPMPKILDYSKENRNSLSFNNTEFIEQFISNAAIYDTKTQEAIVNLISNKSLDENYSNYLAICVLSNQGKNPSRAIGAIREQVFNTSKEITNAYASTLNGTIMQMGCDRTAPVKLTL